MQKLIYRSVNEVKPVWSTAELQKISSLMNVKYRALLNNEQFQVESGTDSNQVQIKVTLESSDKSMFYPIELIHILDSREGESQLTPDEVAALMLDYIDVYWQEYLNDGRDVFVPLAWDKHSCEGVEFFIRGFVRNISLEQQADELFRKHGHGDHEIEPISDEL
ncbi:hypothetical protein EBU99_01290 [bacterium]|nr:hypothetical protein [bacterium]